jgi:hypothetical protein
MDGVRPGVGFIRCGFGVTPVLKEDAFAGEPFKRNEGNPPYEVWAVHTEDNPKETYPRGLSLAYMGIVRHESPRVAYWSTRYMVIANTTESRRQFAGWLADRKDAASRKLHELLKTSYPTDFA